MTALQITLVQPIGSELAISWSDGVETYFPLEALRRACPCAVCGGEADVMGTVIRPRNEHTPKSFELAGYEFVGGYGLQPRWGDGHSTGIYSFAYLRRLAEVG
jgi:DUF971 family protein